MPTEQKLLTFSAALQYYRQSISKHTLFDAACYVFLSFERTTIPSTRLIVLYTLYGLYLDVPLERNPFLTHFLDIVEGTNAANEIEVHFVHCILEGTIQHIKDIIPQYVCDNPNVLPPVYRLEYRLSQLKLSVSRLINDPFAEYSASESSQSIQEKIKVKEEAKTPADQTCYSNQAKYLSHHIEKIKANSELGPDSIKLIQDLMATTHQRTLTIPENELLMHAFHTDPEVVGLCKLNPEDMPQWVELNLLLACELLPLFLKRSDTEDYLQAMLNVPITGHSIEFVHHLATCPDSCCLSNEFLHMYISKSILSCEILNKGAWQDRQVKLVTNFIQSFLEKHIIPMEEYLVEIQSFCIGYLRFKGVAVLFRMVSNQVQKTDYEIGKVLPIDQLAGPSSSSRPSHSPGP